MAFKEAVFMSKPAVSKIDPRICPLCQKNNACFNIVSETDELSCNKDKASCWCQSSEVKFPVQLLQRIPTKLMGKACICAACYQKAVQQEQENVND